MSVSKHNLWKRKKNGVLKLVRSNKMWLERRKHRLRMKDDELTINKESIKTDTHTNKTKVTTTKKTAGSQKRTQVGKRV